MKNFLSKLWSLSRTDRVRTLAIDAVSLPSFCRVNMLKLVSVLVILLTIGSGNAWGAEVVAYTLTCPKNASNSAYGSTYDATISGITWNAHGNQYADGDWRFGGKSITKTNRRAYSKTQLNEDITKIIIAFGAKSSSGITINSVKFNVYSTAAKAAALGDGDISTHTLTYSANGTQTITVPSGKSWNGRWYSVIFNVTVSGSSNKYAALKSITFYKEDAPSCTAPNHVDITGAWDRFAGEQISLTATAYSSAGTGSPIASGDITGYQWYKGGTAEGNKIAGATSATYTKNNCTLADAGDYYCKISTGATCSTMSSSFGVKVYALDCYTGGTATHNFTRVGATQTGTLQLTLTAGTGYQFKVRQGSVYLGNDGTINEDENTWEFTTSGNNVTVNSGLGGTFTFTLDYSSNADEPILAVTYPRKTIYLVPNSDWLSNNAKFAYYYYGASGGTGWTDFIAANECGMAAEIPQWNGITVIAVRFNPTKVSTGNWDDKWNQTNDIALTADKNLITITGWNNSQTYTAYSIPTYTISYAKGSTTYTGGNTISGSKSNETKTCGVDFTLPSSAVFSATGYTQTGWSTSDDGTQDYALGGSYTTNAAQTFYPAWTVKTTTVSFNQNSGTGGQTTSKTATYGSAMPTPITCPTREGYDFGGYYDGSGGTGTKYYNADGTSARNWDKEDATYTLHAKWTIKSYTVNWYVGGSAEGNKLTTGSQTTNVNHGSKITTLPTSSQTSIDCDDKTFQGWTNTTSYTHGTSLLFTDVAGSPTITDVTNFYAVFAAGGDTEDEITVAETGATAESGTYYSWSDVSISSDAVYAGNTAGGSSSNASVQMRSNNSNSGIVTKASGGKVTKVVVDWNSSSVNGRTLDIYGKNTAYTAATDLYDNSTQGTKLGSIVNGTSTELEISGDYSYIGLRSNSGAMYLNSITITWSSATGHTINCTSCANSVTVSYSAPGSGNMMTVTKGSTPIASGTSVKTCSAQSLTVTLTPATHYTVTNFVATGVTGVTTTNVGNVYTVNIPADATGTLTLTPTFTPETPLTITLNTNGKGTYTDPAEWPIYAGESFTLPDVTPSDPTCATFVGWIQGTTFPGDATTHDAPLTISAGSSSGELSVNTTYTAVFYETETAESDAYVKVTSAPVNWANDHYLIVYEDGGVAFDGSLSTLDASSNTVAVSISSGAIAATSALAASEWKIALISGSNYSIQSASGKYIGNASNSNGLTADNTALGNTLSISSENFGVVSAGGAYLRYNATSGQERFRYYKSSSYSSQQAIQLYKLGTAVVETRTYTTNPACTPKYRVTVASVTGGSPNANPKFLPENEEVTLTANPAAGYSFTSWTITKTTGGDDVTTTLLGANATTANTSFSMPAYDVTVTASYAKIPVASLQVKDGETVIANSGTVNISTGANKTLTVVVTPADAFDHSWSASVTGGGTYASITNVQAGTFQVNGLAQGDATVTVTAPNDGDAKTVTFTVHVTDILPTEVVLKRDGSNTSISELSIYEGQYVKVNVSFTPTPTNKDFSVSADGTFVTIHAQAHTNPNYYATLNGKKVTTSPVNVTFTSAATSSVTKNLVVTVLPLLTDTFVDYIHGQATQTVSARLSVDKFTLYTDINTPSLSDASDADPTSADCETSHYHLIGWLPKATAEALWAAGTAITESTEGLVKAGVQVEATGQTWYAIWGKEQ